MVSRLPTSLVVMVLLLIGIIAGHGSGSVFAQTPIQISMTPLATEIIGERGQTVPFTVNLVNNSRFQTARFRVHAAALREGRSGDYAPTPPDGGRFDASSWVSFDQTEFEIAPGATYEVRGKVTIPRDAGASGYAAVVMNLLPEQRVGQAALSVEYIQQFVTALEIVVGRRHVRSAHVDSMAVIPAGSVRELASLYGDRAVLFVGSVVNDGDVHVVGKGRLIIRDERGRRIRETPLGGGRGVVLPDTTVDFVSVLGGLTPGDYEMQTIIDYGGGRPAIGRMNFTLTDDSVGISQAVAGRAVRMDASPDSLSYEFPRHGYRARTVTIVNRDTVDVDFTVKLAELVKDESGESVAVEEGIVMPYSAVEWGDIRPQSFTLRPGQRRNVVIGFRVPEGEAGGRYARVIVEGVMPAPEPGMEAARSEIALEALLLLGTEFASQMAVSEVEWRVVGDTGLVSVGATIVNKGDIHGPADMTLSLLGFTPAREEDMGDFVLVTGERWDVVDVVDVEVTNVALLPGQRYFVFGTFHQELEANRQYQVLVDVSGEAGARNASAELWLWRDDDGVIHEGLHESFAEDGNDGTP